MNVRKIAESFGSNFVFSLVITSCAALYLGVVFIVPAVLGTLFGPMGFVLGMILSIALVIATFLTITEVM